MPIVPHKQLPPQLATAGERLERQPSPENHLRLASQTQKHLADSNVDSYLAQTPSGMQFVVIKPESVDPKKPTHQLTHLANELLRQNVALNFSTGNYLAGIAGFLGLELETLGDRMSLGVSWKELDEDGEFDTELDHELRHVEQHQERLKARESGQVNPFPDIRVRYEDESAALSPWVAQHYNGKYGHSIDEHDAYLHQAQLELKRAQENFRAGHSDKAQGNIRKTLDLAVRSALFAISDADALNLKNPKFSADKPHTEGLHGDLKVSDGQVTLWVDTRDVSTEAFLTGMNRQIQKLKQGGLAARDTALEAFQLLKEGQTKNAWLGEFQALGWLNKD